MTEENLETQELKAQLEETAEHADHAHAEGHTYGAHAVVIALSVILGGSLL